MYFISLLKTKYIAVLILLSCLNIIPSHIFSQSDDTLLVRALDSSEYQFDTTQQEYFSNFENTRYIKNIYVIDINDITVANSNSNIYLDLPFFDCILSFKTKYYEFDSLSNYYYYGELIEDSVNCEHTIFGSISLISNEQKYGHLLIDSQNFVIEDLSGGPYVLLEVNNDSINYINTEDSIIEEINVKNYRIDYETVDLLVLYSDQALIESGSISKLHNTINSNVFAIN